MTRKDQIKKEMTDKARSFVEGASSCDMQDVYTWGKYRYTIGDIDIYCENNGFGLIKDEIENVAYQYAYESRYDCNIGYWENLGRLINEARKGN